MITADRGHRTFVVINKRLQRQALLDTLQVYYLIPCLLNGRLDNLRMPFGKNIGSHQSCIANSKNIGILIQTVIIVYFQAVSRSVGFSR